MLLGNHNVGMGTFGLHGLILCVSEDFLSQLLCIHNVGIETIYPEVSYFLWAAIHCPWPHVSIPIPLILHLERLAQSQCQLMVKNLFEVALNIHPLYQ